MLIGHEKQWNFLKRSIELDKLSHAYLFAGQEKLGKKKLALEWISLLFKKDLQRTQHSDLILIEPQEKEIQIAQIRNLSWKLSLKPYLTPFKIAIIDRAHLMNQEAQTSLLKTLEEPKGNAILILITEHPEIIFPTILSRVQIIKFYPVKKEEIKNYLKKQGISEEKSEEVAKISLGRPGAAIEFISDSQRLESQKKIVEKLIEISNSNIASRFHYAKAISQEPNLGEILEIWISYFRNILLTKLNGGNNLNQYSLPKLKNILKLIQKTNFLISTTNVNPKLALETLMLEL